MIHVVAAIVNSFAVADGRWEFIRRDLPVTIIDCFEFYTMTSELYKPCKLFVDYAPNKYVGCFEDDKKHNRGIRYEMGSNNSPKRCMNICNTHRFKYAEVQG